MPSDSDDSSLFLRCIPPLNRTERNPGVRILVEATFENGKLKSFDVTHELYSGLTVSRTDQYAIRIAEGTRGFWWNGTWRKNPSITMSGKTYLDRRGQWHYQETQYENGFRKIVIDNPCQPTEEGG